MERSIRSWGGFSCWGSGQREARKDRVVDNGGAGLEKKGRRGGDVPLVFLRCKVKVSDFLIGCGKRR